IFGLGCGSLGFGTIIRALLGFGWLLIRTFRVSLACGGLNLRGRFLLLSLGFGRGLFGLSFLRLGLLFRGLFLLLLFVSLFFCHQFLSSCSRSMPRSLATVSSRATSRRTAVTREVFSSSPVECWSRSANCSSRVWRIRSTS